MANDLNRCSFIGRLGRDPEVRYMPDGQAAVNVSIAVGSSWKDQSGDRKESTEWVPIAFFGKLAEVVGEYLQKGSQIYVAGKFKTRKWTDKSGNERYTTEIVAQDMQMLGSVGRDVKNDSASPRAENRPSRGVPRQPSEDDFGDDMDIPF